MSANAQNHPSNIFVATNKNTGDIVQIIVHHQNQNGRDVWIASIPGVRGLTQSNLSAAETAAKMASMMRCGRLTEINVNPGAAATSVVKKEPTPEEEFDELLKKYVATVLPVRPDPSAVLYTRNQVTEFVKDLIQKNKLLQSRVDQLETEVQARDDQWSQWR